MKTLPLMLLGGVAVAGAVGAGLAGFAGLTARRVEAALPPQGRFVDIAFNRIHYLDVGSGPAILMVHGLGGQMRNFTYALVDRLKDRFRVVVMERPGAGYSQRAPGASARLGVQAEVVADFVRELGLERPLVVGHSLGGALALTVAVRFPGLVSGLALVSPLSQVEDGDGVPAAFRGMVIPSPLARRVVSWTLATPMALANRNTVLSELFGPDPTPDDFPTRGGGALALRPRTFYSTSTDLMAASEDLPHVQARYGELKLPVGVLFGAADRILDPEVHGASLIRQVPGLTYETIEGAGHMIPLTRPDRVAAFIEGVAGRAFGRTA